MSSAVPPTSVATCRNRGAGRCRQESSGRQVSGSQSASGKPNRTGLRGAGAFATRQRQPRHEALRHEVRAVLEERREHRKAPRVGLPEVPQAALRRVQEPSLIAPETSFASCLNKQGGKA